MKVRKIAKRPPTYLRVDTVNVPTGFYGVTQRKTKNGVDIHLITERKEFIALYGQPDFDTTVTITDRGIALLASLDFPRVVPYAQRVRT
ncbi:hypothetical protein BcepSauron_336 [Burkholderia phage BcepSauron]|uniref:Uncharacterized protein n=1 Tax=Burkholderia phage BcepSauron TaxID=2530033 RepID=A0A482MMG1_9CAUD|nr:hypothetical protein H1O17_gp336 [Burkholderia phage BcepSauron]QBQ74716.1 hypothetical protein BcepSauron_336 [Burkholderia phage BcepSauron]